MSRQFRLTNQNGEDVTDKLRGFAKTIGLERAAGGRYSVALLLGVYGGFVSRMQNPWKVVRKIEALEGLGPTSTTKPAQPFTGKHLNGLMHKHYHADGLSSLALNLRNEIKRSGIPAFVQRVAEAEAAGEKRYMTLEDAKLIAHDASVGSFERRMARGEFTGEWIIYAAHGGKNYYLCLGRHDSGDVELKRQIEAVCCEEFPFLRSLPAFTQPS